LRSLGFSLDFYATFTIVANALFALGFLMIAGLLIWRRPDDRLAVVTSFALTAFPIGFLYQTTLVPSGWSLPARIIGFLGGCGLSLTIYLFPTGHFVPPWTRWLMIGWVVYEGVERFVAPAPFTPFARVLSLNTVLFLALLASLVATQVYRYRRVSTARARQQTKWVVFGASVGIVGLISLIFLSALFPVAFQPGAFAFFIGYSVLLLCVFCIPVSIGIAISRSHLWDIDVIIQRSLVYALLTLGVIGVYSMVVVALSAALRTSGNLALSLLATGLIAVVFQPARLRVQRGVCRLFYGQRDEPYAILSRFGRQLEATPTPDAILPTIVRTVAQTLKLPYVAIEIERGETFFTAAEYGAAHDTTLSCPLVYQGEAIGRLLLAPRAPGETFALSERRLFDELARQIGLAAHAVRLTSELQHANTHLVAARARLVTAREEERRRLRRDLHDGLGPTLAALTLKIGAARKLLPRDPAAADALLYDLGADIETTVSDIRRLVYDLRPPTLDELGLVETLRECVVQRASASTTSDMCGEAALQCTLTAPNDMRALPAAVEVAAYRIAQEAVTNVVRHAHARSCWISISLADGWLSLEVRDDGVGRAATLERPKGIGIHSMRERATELGGNCVFEAAPAGGTRVLARLPLPSE
jgi:signal transduction histidine kinase